MLQLQGEGNIENNFRRFLIVTLITTLLAVPAFGQQLISSSANGSMSAAALNGRVSKVYGKYAVPEASTAVELYKITYRSLDANGKPAELTGLVAWPAGGVPMVLVV